MVPSGATGYVQVCDGFANKKIKELITEREEIHYDQHEDEWRRGKFSVSDRRVLLAHWVLEAYNELHEKYSHLIVKGFEQVGLSLNPNGRDDWKLKIRDLPDIEVGDYERPPPSPPLSSIESTPPLSLLSLDNLNICENETNLTFDL